MTRTVKKLVIMGAAGRDFHNFNVCYRNDPHVKVVAFTATQIPSIINRIYPPELAGWLYPEGILIRAEEELPHIIKERSIDEVVFAYSDVSHEYVMHRASLCLSLGSSFVLLGPKAAMLESKRPVISITAVRTGSGKSSVAKKITLLLKDADKKAAVIRHPMPYGDLVKGRVQRFSCFEDLKKYDCTIEEMEEYWPHIEAGLVVYAGVDYEAVLAMAEDEADIIVWDGGNNDFSFIRPDLEIVVADPLRPGHELLYHPGETNLRRAHIVIINKVDSAAPSDIETVKRNIKGLNPSARIIETRSIITVDNPQRLIGKKALVIEDGPTLTHGGMGFGAGIKAAGLFGAVPVDPRPFAVGSIKETLERYTELKTLVPAMGYSKAQIKDLEETINSAGCDIVLSATTVDLEEIIKVKKPVIRVSYDVEETEGPGFKGLVSEFILRCP
ncbi:MAG: GTPase [Deltaproteobacteria bacterium]|nr:GTPase [Deltaproteobacteria bacterium]